MEKNGKPMTYLENHIESLKKDKAILKQKMSYKEQEVETGRRMLLDLDSLIEVLERELNK